MAGLHKELLQQKKTIESHILRQTKHKEDLKKYGKEKEELVIRLDQKDLLIQQLQKGVAISQEKERKLDRAEKQLKEANKELAQTNVDKTKL